MRNIIIYTCNKSFIWIDYFCLKGISVNLHSSSLSRDCAPPPNRPLKNPLFGASGVSTGVKSSPSISFKIQTNYTVNTLGNRSQRCTCCPGGDGSLEIHRQVRRTFWAVTATRWPTLTAVSTTRLKRQFAVSSSHYWFALGTRQHVCLESEVM